MYTGGRNGVMVIVPDCHPGAPGSNLRHEKEKRPTPPTAPSMKMMTISEIFILSTVNMAFTLHS